MKKNTLIIIILSVVFVAVLIGAAVNVQIKKHNQNRKTCSVLDKRFECKGAINFYGGKLTFTKVPGGIFALSFAEIEEDSDKSLDKKFIKTCRINGSHSAVTADTAYSITCGNIPKGKYLMHFKLTHKSPKAYKPVKGETCLLKTDGYWYCTTSGWFVGERK